MNINDLIILTKPKIRPIENPKDIELCNDIIKCKICGGASGTLKIITHLYYNDNDTMIPCIYKTQDNDIDEPVIIGNYNKSKIRIDPNIAEGILQREYTIINTKANKIIGSFGSGSCIIICLRNRITCMTFLCHLDALTIEYTRHFYNFDPNDTDVYIVGGDDSSIHILHKLLLILDSMKFKITFAYVIDDLSNSFAINTLTGDIYLNEEIYNPLIQLPIKTDSKYRNNRLMSSFYMQRTPLFNVNII